MRLRNIPGAKDAIAESIYVIQNPQENKGNWDKVFPQSACPSGGWHGKRPLSYGYGEAPSGNQLYRNRNV